MESPPSALPAIGPTLGGWITDNYSWRWIFYINVPVGALALALVYQLVEDPPYLARLRKRLSGFDFIGFSLLTLGVGALQIALDKGQEDDWFGSNFIMTLIVIAAAGLLALVIWEWFQKEPIVDVRLFKNFNVATTNLMFLMLGAALFSSTVLMPQLLQTLMGYPAQKAGMVLSAGALVVLVVLPMVGKLTTRFQARHIIACGWIGLAVSMYISSKQVDLLMSFRSATLLRVWQYIPVAFLFVPLTLAGYVGLPAEKTNAAAAYELYAEHGAEHRHIGRYNPHCSTQSISSIRPGRIHSFWPVSRFCHRSCNAPDARRFKRVRRATAGNGPSVRNGSGPSCSSLLHRGVLAAGCGLGGYVCRFIFSEEK
jgi:EmrB/QacA subfamily drug resistance transporter